MGSEASPALSRRTVLGVLGGGALGGAALGAAAARALERDVSSPLASPSENSDGSAPPGAAARVECAGASQAGVDRPWAPQRHALLLVLGWESQEPAPELAALGERILELTGADAGNPILPDGAGDLTVTVGLGPELVRIYGASLPGGEPLPLFRDDERIDPQRLGGDLMLLIAADDPGALDPVADALRVTIPGAELRWKQRGARSPSDGPRARNPLGFHDGVIVPQGEDELTENVWFGPRDARATICVIRRFRLDRQGFTALSLPDRERAIGRDLSGVPLTGGDPFAEGDLQAKTPEGEFVIPARSHLRAAHPSFTGSRLMLRRSYAYDDGADDAGLLFISYQRDLRSYVETQRRMDEVGDELMSFARATASATFLVLPGFTQRRPLGKTLHADE
jgi:dye decolorizing peroxidase